MSKLVLEKLAARLGPKLLETHSHVGDDTALVSPDAWHDAALFLRDDNALDFDLFIDLCAVDYPIFRMPETINGGRVDPVDPAAHGMADGRHGNLCRPGCPNRPPSRRQPPMTRSPLA